MSFELAGWCEFSQLVSNHELRYIHRDKFVAIVHSKCVAHKIRCDSGTAAPCFDDAFFVFAFIDSQYLFFYMISYIRTFFFLTCFVFYLQILICLNVYFFFFIW